MKMREFSSQRSSKAITALLFMALALICGLFMVTGCSSSETSDKNADDSAHSTASTEEAVTDESSTADGESDMHQMVCLPLNDFGMTGFFDEEYLWGVEIAGSPQVVVLHIAEGGLVNQDGQPMNQDTLKPGDIIECSFNMITNSFPGQVSVDKATYIENGGEAAIEPYLPSLEELRNSAIPSAEEVE